MEPKEQTGKLTEHETKRVENLFDWIEAWQKRQALIEANEKAS